MAAYNRTLKVMASAILKQRDNDQLTNEEEAVLQEVANSTDPFEVSSGVQAVTNQGPAVRGVPGQPITGTEPPHTIDNPDPMDPSVRRAKGEI